MARALLDDLVAAGANALENLRRLVVEQGIGIVHERNAKFVGEIEQPPDADAIAVVAPGVIALGLRLAVLGLSCPRPLPNACTAMLVVRQNARRLPPGQL